MASTLFILRAWQSSHTTSLQVVFGLPLSWSWTLNFILHTFLHPIIIFFSQHIPIPTQPVLLQYQCYVICTYCLSQLLTWESVFYLNAIHPPDHSHLCSLKCYHVFFPYRPGLTSMQYAACRNKTQLQIIAALPCWVPKTIFCTSGHWKSMLYIGRSGITSYGHDTVAILWV